ncbi:MAG: YeeE/YedE family protein, partial [Bacteroidia bacterium]|nr:YeeE/YedE family protein [Bacteroidia bacterium]
MQLIEFISQPWHWAVSGSAIVVIMYLLLWYGEEFGVSSNLRTLCTMMGAGKNCDFFQISWRNQLWNLIFVFGAIFGGFIAVQYLASPDPVQISEATQSYLSSELGISTPQQIDEGLGYVPKEIYGSVGNVTNLFILVLGGILVGFGARYAGGCTSGHAISGLSNLQLPSLIAVIGFFIGGLLM